MDRLIVSTFPNAKALPLWIAAGQGFFAAQGLDVEIHETGSSREQRELLASGGVHLVQAAVDNALSMIVAGHDVLIIMGGESGMNDLMVQAEIGSFEDLKGQVLAVDSPDTAYALLVRRILDQHGLQLQRDYSFRAVGNGARRLKALLADQSIAGAVLNPPFTAQAQLAGLKSLGRLVDLLGPYQAGGAFVLRSFAQSQPDRLIAYMAAYIEALRWLRDDANSAALEDLLRERLGLDGQIAAATRRDLLDEASGFTPDARFNAEGFEAVLATRAQTQGPQERLAQWHSFVDEDLYQQALMRVTR